MENIFVAGIDEAGRGPLAGPVTASCVILPPDFPLNILNDSKKLSPKKREAAEKIIKETACWGIGVVDNKEIDRINILQADFKAMKIAFDMMCLKLPAWCRDHGIECIDDFRKIEGIVDGNQLPPDIDCNIRWEIKADAKFECVMAASILAKTCRDSIMIEYDRLYPEYGYAGHKGYPTRAHREICRKLGPSPIQRLSFKY